MFRRKTKRQDSRKQPDKPRSLLAHASHFGLKSAFDAASLVLCASSLGISSVIFMVGTGREIPVPPILIRHYAEALEKQGFGVTCGGLYFDFTGGLRAEDVRVTGMNGMDILRIRQAYTHIIPDGVIGGTPVFDTLIIDDATLFQPAYISDSGEESAVVGNLHTQLIITPRKIHVAYLEGRIGNLTTTVTTPFDIDLRALAAKEGKAQEADTRLPAAQIASRLAAAARAVTVLSALEAPSVTIALAQDLSGADLHLLARSVDAGDVTARAVEVKAALDKTLVIKEMVLSADSVVYSGARAEDVRFRLSAPLAVPRHAPEWRELSASAVTNAAKLFWHGETFFGVHLTADRMAGSTNLDSSFVFDALPVKLSARLTDDFSASVDFDTFAREDTVLRIANVETEKVTSRFHSDVPFRVLGRADIPREHSAATVAFEVWGRDMNARGMPLENAYVKGNYGNGILDCSAVRIRSGGSDVEGTFRQDVRTLDWRMCLRGSVYPPELGPVLGRRWWDPIWEDFVFDGPRVDADLDLSGNWHERHYANIVGFVGLNHVLYNGVRVERGVLDLWTGKGFVDISNLHAVSDEGSLKGELAWLLHQPEEHMEVTFRFDSDLPVESLDKAFGSVMAEELPDWSFSGPPRLCITGNLHKLAPGKWQDLVHAVAHAENGSWRGIHFDVLDAEIWNDNAGTIIRLPAVSTLGGKLSGVIQHDRSAAEKMLSLDLALAETDLSPTLAALQSLGGKKEETAQARHGKVNMTYRGSALLKDVPGTIAGSGQFAIHDADLARIKVFGALSRLLDSIGLGYGTFTIDSISSDFTTRNGFARLRHTSLAGPAARIEAKGRVGMVDKSLDFDAKVFLLSTDKVSFMNLFGTILTPFGYIMELNLKGTLDEPTWRFKIDPRNIFDGAKSALQADPKVKTSNGKAPARKTK
jgi:hypothetical protein